MATQRARLTVRRQVANRSLARTAPREPSPVVKWAGGKTKLLPEILARVPASYNRYLEPFLGGAALFFKMAPKTALLNDKNPDLVAMYQSLAWDVEPVIRRLTKMRGAHSEEYYYATRDRWNDERKSMSDADRAATFVYLNKTCYNGLWRVNSKGRFNVPVGRYVNPRIFEPEQLRAASVQLRRAKMMSGSFRDAGETAKKGDFVYFDPPYQPLNDTAKFTSYTSDSFGPDDQADLASLFAELSARGVHVLLSNSDTPLIRKLYKGFRIDKVECARAINSRAAKRGPVTEVLISNR